MFRQSQLLKIHTTTESAGINPFQGLMKNYSAQALTITERVGTDDLQVSGESYFLQIRAIGKGIPTNLCHGVRHNYMRYTLASKGLFADGDDSFGDGNLFTCSSIFQQNPVFDDKITCSCSCLLKFIFL